MERARDAAEGLLAAWDDHVADGLFAMNMDLDEPRAFRRATIEAALARVGGPLRRDIGRPATATSPAELAWWLRGERGWLHVSIQVTPEPQPLVQSLVLDVVMDPSACLVEVGSALLAAATSALTSAVTWPDGVAAAPALDAAATVRSLSAAGARQGTMRLGEPIAGDGATTATWVVFGERGRAELRVTLDGASGPVTAVRLASPWRAVLDEGW